MTMNGSQRAGMPVPLDLRTKARERRSHVEDSTSHQDSPTGTACNSASKDYEKDITKDAPTLHALENLPNDSPSLKRLTLPCGSSPIKSVQQSEDSSVFTAGNYNLPIPQSDPQRPLTGESPKYETGLTDVRTIESDCKPAKTPVSNLPLRKRPFPAAEQKDSPATKLRRNTPNQREELHQRAQEVHPPFGSNETERWTPIGWCQHSASSAANCHRINPYHMVVNMPFVPFTFPVHPIEKESWSLEVAMATHQDDDGDTALHIAVVQGREMMVHRLIHILLQTEKDLDVYNNLRQTPLHLAVITHQVALVQALLRAGADPGTLDRHGQTAVHLCCEHNLSSCLDAVLEYPASQVCLKVRNYEGLTPLHLAVQSGNRELVKLLLASGADIDAVDFKSGRSSLMHAVENNTVEMVSFLIENGSNVNVQSYSGNTALHSACGRGQVEAVRLLLRSGADSSLKNYHNDTALMVAKNKKVTDVLRGKGSRSQNPRTVEQPCDSLSPQRHTPQSRQHSINGTPVPSPSQSLCPSPLATANQVPQHVHHSPSHSPADHILSQSTEHHSVDQPPITTEESGLQHLQLNHVQPTVTADYGMAQGMHDSPMDTIISGCPLYHLQNVQRTFYPEPTYIIVPKNLSQLPNQTQPPCYAQSYSRPSSRSSDQSDTSTMSVSSGVKGES